MTTHARSFGRFLWGSFLACGGVSTKLSAPFADASDIDAPSSPTPMVDATPPPPVVASAGHLRCSNEICDLSRQVCCSLDTGQGPPVAGYSCNPGADCPPNTVELRCEKSADCADGKRCCGVETLRGIATGACLAESCNTPEHRYYQRCATSDECSTGTCSFCPVKGIRICSPNPDCPCE
jgi:hypothetical protein